MLPTSEKENKGHYLVCSCRLKDRLQIQTQFKKCKLHLIKAFLGINLIMRLSGLELNVSCQYKIKLHIVKTNCGSDISVNSVEQGEGKRIYDEYKNLKLTMLYM